MTEGSVFKAHGIRLPEFGGDSSTYEDWRFSFKSFVGMVQPEWIDLLEAAQSADRAVLNSGLTTEAQAASKKLFYMLSSLSQGAARILLRKQPPGEGLEAWRQLHLRHLHNHPSAVLGACTAASPAARTWEAPRSFHENTAMEVDAITNKGHEKGYDKGGKSKGKGYFGKSRGKRDGGQAGADNQDAEEVKGKAKVLAVMSRTSSVGPSASQVGTSFSGACHRCGKYGHRARDCTSNINQVTNEETFSCVGSSNEPKVLTVRRVLSISVSDQLTTAVGVQEVQATSKNLFHSADWVLCLVDSGAYTHVAPPEFAPGWPTRSLAERKVVTADGPLLP